MINEKEIVIWLAGLLSTDGMVKTKSRKGGNFNITSVEEDWLKIIKRRLSEVGLLTRITPITNWNFFVLRIYNPYKITSLLVKYKCEKYFNPRKWKDIIGMWTWYNSGGCRNSAHTWSIWTEEEEEIIIKNPELCGKDLKKFLVNRTLNAIYLKRSELIQRGQLLPHT